MTIADQITRLNNAKAAIKQSLENKGVTVSDSALLDEYPALINSIEVGSGGGGDPYYEDLYNMRTSNGTDMGYMFYYFTGSVDASKLDTSKATNVSYMFSYANTDNIILTGMSFPSTKSLGHMFDSASGTTLDLSSWDISNITDMSNMFSYCYSLQSLDLSNWDASNVTNMSWMFSGCYYLQELHLDNCNNNTISKIITSSDLPTDAAMDGGARTIYCKRSEVVGLTAPTNWVFSYVEESGTPLYVPGQFQYSMEVTEVRTMVDESHNDLSNMFSGCMNLVSVNTEDWDTSNVTNMSSMFSGCYSLPSLDVSNFDTSKVTYMNSMFSSCNALQSLDLSNFDTSKVTDMSSMFSFSSLQSLDISNWDTINVDNMRNMFQCCMNLTSLDVSSFDTSKVTDMSYMFNSCMNLTSLDLSNWDTSNVSNMDNMFGYCNSLTSIGDVSNWGTGNVTNMSGMFSGCSNLTSLDLSNWDTSKVTNMDYMFDSCYSLTELHLDNWSNANISKIITSSNLPTDVAMDGGARTIYCKKSEAAGLTPPEGWVFSYVDVPLYVSGKFQNNIEITEVSTMVDKSHYSLDSMFSGCSNLVSVNTEDWDTSTISNMRSMFEGCTSLTQLDLSNFNTAMVYSTYMMFFNCTSLTTLNLSNWETGNVFMPEMDMDAMFSGCTSLHTLRLDNCSNDTINKIILYSGLPTNAIEGVTRTIYCKEENAAGLTAPTNWQFSYVD